jgi:Flp pilus assembly protein TadG
MAMQATMAMQARRGRVRDDRGAAAVEFALLLPLLLLLVFGIIDFGRAINAQITITQAAREGARVLALPGGTAPTSGGLLAYQARAQAAAIGLSGVSVTATATCPVGGATAGDDAKVQVTYQFSFVTPIGAIARLFGSSGFGSPITLTANGVMPCET